MNVADVAALAITYLVASISFPQVLARAHGVDLHRVGTRNLGGGNLTREVGPVAGITGGLLDSLKPPVAILVARVAGLDPLAQTLCGVAAVAAQQWPIWHGFDGGRGNAPAMALLIVLSLRAAVLVAPVALAGILWGVWLRARLRRRVFSRGTPLGLLLALLLYPVAARAVGEDGNVVLAGALTAILVVARRLTAGIREDLAASEDPARTLANRLLFDRTEIQRRALS